MNVFFKLCTSIVRRNKGFTAGLFVMSVLSAAIAFLGANFGPSSEKTIMNFITESGMPDALYSTDPLPESTAETLETIEGVRSVSPRLVFDTGIETGDGSLFAVRIFGWDPDAPFRHAVHGGSAETGGSIGAFLSNKFAEHNGIRAGDGITVRTPFGEEKLTVEAVVSNPETMSCVKDEMSAYESYQFAYLYIRRDDLEKLTGIGGTADQWLVYFDEGLSESEEKSVMADIRAALGGHLVSEIDTDESEALKTVRDDLKTIGVLCSFIPGIIWLISLGFGFIFIRIIIENQRKTIGLLRALGFSIAKVVAVFIAYTALINLPALLCGIPLGYGLLTVCLKAIAAAEGIVDTVPALSLLLTCAMMLAVFLIGAASALMSAKAIAGIDPSEAYGGTALTDTEPPEFLSRLRTDAFFKISLVSILRSHKRQLCGAFCITACVISMCVGFEGVLTVGHPIDAVFGERYRYDLTVRSIDGEVCSEIGRSVEGIDRIEPMMLFSAELNGESVRVSTLSEDAELTVLNNASGERIFPGGGIIIDEMRALLNGISVGDDLLLDGQPITVTGIAREILFPVMYVSPQTAQDLGHGDVRGAMIRLSEGADIGEVKKQITDLCASAYFAEFSSQKENIRNGFSAMRTIMLIFALLAFFIGSLLIFNMTVIDFNEKKVRYATLRALGTPVKRLRVISLTENLFRVGLGAAVACPLCYLCVSVLLKLLSGASQQYVMVRYPECLLLSCLIPFLYLLLGVGISSHRIRKMNFIDYLNEVE